jgi:hypothetical protein
MSAAVGGESVIYFVSESVFEEGPHMYTLPVTFSSALKVQDLAGVSLKSPKVLRGSMFLPHPILFQRMLLASAVTAMSLE